MKRTRNLFHYQVRKCRRVEDYLRNKKIIENCVENDTDLFAEIRRQRSNDNQEDVTIDGAVGKDIPNKFSEIYSELFNREDDENDVLHISGEIERNINADAHKELDKINQRSSLNILLLC